MRLELTHTCVRQILSLMRLPFRHAGTYNKVQSYNAGKRLSYQGHILPFPVFRHIPSVQAMPERGKPESRPFCAAVIPYPKINPLCLGQISTASAMNKALAGQKQIPQYFHVIRNVLDRAY